MSFHRNIRILLAFIGLVSAALFPPWVPLVCMGALAFRYRAAEAILIGLVVDLLWLPTGSLFSPIPIFTIAGIVLVWGLEPLRNEYLVS